MHQYNRMIENNTTRVESNQIKPVYLESFE